MKNHIVTCWRFAWQVCGQRNVRKLIVLILSHSHIIVLCVIYFFIFLIFLDFFGLYSRLFSKQGPDNEINANSIVFRLKL